MAPNPIMIPRSQRQSLGNQNLPNPEPDQSPLGITTPLLATAALVALVASVQWARRWTLSGCAIESLVILYGSGYGSRIFPQIPLWTLLATLNLVYAICSTSWLLHALFTAAMPSVIALTCLFQFVWAADVARKLLRKALKQLHFTRDKIALFNLPALEIDTTVDGLFVIRGLTIELSSLTIVAHGIELGMKLAEDIELAIHVDEVKIPLFRRIEIGDVLGNIKGGAEMTFADMEDKTDEADDDSSIFINDTPLLRAATAGSEGFKDRPKLRESLTGTYIKDSSAKAGLDSITTLSPDDEIADKQYREILTDIRTSSAVYQSRARVRKNAKTGQGFTIDNEKDLRAAVCAEMHELPSVPHPPTRSVKVTTLQNLSKPAVRRFLHRLPFLLRLLLMPLSYFHPMSISSISAAGSGTWLRTLLKQQIFKDYAANNAELRRLERKLSTWLADANFCLQLTDILGSGQVPLSTAFDVVAYLKFADIMAYRTVPNSSTLAQVVRLGGADATFTIPSFLLPHHEHLLPPKPTVQDEELMVEEIEHADGKPKAVQAEQTLEHLQKDETTVTMSVHGSLPAVFDQSLLNFIAALVKATKVIEFEKEAGEDDTTANDIVASNGNEGDNGSRNLTLSPTPSISSIDSGGDAELTTSPTTTTGSKTASFNAFTRKTLQSLKDVSTKEGIREKVRDLHQATRDGVKKAMVGGMINDRWIAKMVGKVAAQLERAQGDLGYSGDIPVPLAPYRAASELPSKLLP